MHLKTLFTFVKSEILGVSLMSLTAFKTCKFLKNLKGILSNLYVWFHFLIFLDTVKNYVLLSFMMNPNFCVEFTKELNTS